MPKTEPSLLTHPSTEIINPVASAFQFYLLQLHEQYPGIFAQFAISDIDPTAPLAQNIPTPYQIHGRLFFKGFAINEKPFEYTRNPLTQTQTNTILDPIKLAVNQTEHSLNHHDPVEDSLSQFCELRQAVLQSTLFYLQETTSDTPSPDEHIRLAFNQTDFINEMIKPIQTVQPKYTNEQIERILNYRNQTNRHTLTSDGIHLLRGLLAAGFNGLKTPAQVQALGFTKIAGAVLFKIISEAEIQGSHPLPTPLKKFITKITNAPGNDADIIFRLLLEQHEQNLKTEFSLETLLKHLKHDPDPKRKADIKDTLDYFTNNLKNILINHDFLAFHAHSFTILFEHFQHCMETLSPHPETQYAYQLCVLDFMNEQFDHYKDYPAIMPHAISLLENMSFPKKHFHAHSAKKKHQACLERCEDQRKIESLKRFSKTLKPMEIMDGPEHSVEALIKKASDGKSQPRFIKSNQRTKSSFTLVNAEESGKRRKEKFSRGISHLNLFTSRPRTNSLEDAGMVREETSPKVSPRFTRKKHPRHDAQIQMDSSPEPSPNQPRKPKHKARKTEIAPVFSSSPPKREVTMPDLGVKTLIRQKRLSQ